MQKQNFPLASSIRAAQGQEPCDFQITDVTFLDVFTARWRKGTVSVKDGWVVGLADGLPAKRVVDGRGKWLVPGFIDAHVHVESSMLLPESFQGAVLARGTTTAICDPHELANVLGVKGIEYFLAASEKLHLDLRVMLSSCVPATHLETNGGGTISAEALYALSSHKNALGLAEMMNVPGVLFGDPEILKKLELFQGRPIDGHAPLVRGNALAAYACAGISSCHESTELEEAREKLIHGMKVWIREGSVAKDLDALVSLLDAKSSPQIGFCTDDRNPLDISEEGHVDFLVRKAIHHGIEPELCYRSASWSVARHYGLSRVGAIAPGYRADLVLLNDAKACAVDKVWSFGKAVDEIPLQNSTPASFPKTVQAKPPEVSDLKAPEGKVFVIGVEPGKILTKRLVMNHDAPGVSRLSVLERYGQGSKPANAYAHGFGENFRGAIGSSVGHDSHNLIVVARDPKDMRAAFSALIDQGGGYVVVEGGKVLGSIALPFGGLMTSQSAGEVARTLKDLREKCRALGCALPEPFLQLAFLSLPVIPQLKLTDKGLVDVEKFDFISVSA